MMALLVPNELDHYFKDENNISVIATPNTAQFIEIDNVKYHGG